MIVLSFFDAVSDWGSFSSGVISISESELLEPKVVDGFVRLLKIRLRLKLPDCVEIFTIAVLLSVYLVLQLKKFEPYACNVKYRKNILDW